MEKIVRIGKISTLNYERGCADVYFEDEENCVKTDIPFFSSEYKMPNVGEVVVVIFQSSGNKSQGFILGPIFNSMNRPAFSGKGNYYKKFSDTAFIKYDSENDTLELSAGKVIIKNMIE